MQMLKPSKLLSLGFEEHTKNVFIKTKPEYCNVTHKVVPVEVARIVLSHTGCIIASEGIPKDANGELLLYWRG